MVGEHLSETNERERERKRERERERESEILFIVLLLQLLFISRVHFCKLSLAFRISSNNSAKRKKKEINARCSEP